MTIPIVAIPGSVMPAAPRYQPVAAALAGVIELHPKDLEVYADDRPPVDYSIGLEVEALGKFADSLGLERFHLLGYSGGGFVSLAFAGTHPERLLSLALFEPASIPGPLTQEEATLFRSLGTGLAGKSGPEYMSTFMQLQVRAGVQLTPPAGPPPPWMATRPAGIAAMITAIESYGFDRESFRACHFPVFLGHGALTGVHEEIRAGILARLLPDVHVRRFEGMHHFLPPEQIYVPEHIAELRRLWTRAGAT